MKKALPIVLWLLPGLALAADNKIIIGRTSLKEPSAIEVMEVQGCNLEWISQVLKDTELNQSDAEKPLKLIPSPVYLRAPSCKTEPPESVRRASASILRNLVHVRVPQEVTRIDKEAKSHPTVAIPAVPNEQPKEEVKPKPTPQAAVPETPPVVKKKPVAPPLPIKVTDIPAETPTDCKGEIRELSRGDIKEEAGKVNLEGSDYDDPYTREAVVDLADQRRIFTKKQWDLRGCELIRANNEIAALKNYQTRLIIFLPLGGLLAGLVLGAGLMLGIARRNMKKSALEAVRKANNVIPLTKVVNGVTLYPYAAAAYQDQPGVLFPLWRCQCGQEGLSTDADIEQHTNKINHVVRSSTIAVGRR